MNLIEQLGGYEKARQILISCEFYGRKDLRVPVAGGFIHIVVDFLEKDLLDYRKEHNIFEVGDKVVSIDKYSNDMLFTVTELTSKNVFTSMEFGEIAYSFVRHAKAEEIQAGRRL